jgi:hypothetical protein
MWTMAAESCWTSGRRLKLDSGSLLQVVEMQSKIIARILAGSPLFKESGSSRSS